MSPPLGRSQVSSMPPRLPGVFPEPSKLGQALRYSVGAALSVPGHWALRTMLSRGCPEGFPFGKGISLGQSQDAGEVPDVAWGFCLQRFPRRRVVSALPSWVQRGHGCEFCGLQRGWGTGEGPSGCLLPSRGSARGQEVPLTCHTAPPTCWGSPAHLLGVTQPTSTPTTARSFPSQPCPRALRWRGCLG